jgi:FtsP/CotA-like multicopper oxidase with cupredoxin domain
VTPRARIAVLFAAAVVLVAGIVLAQSAGGDDAAGTQAETPSQTQAAAPSGARTTTTPADGDVPRNPEATARPAFQSIELEDGVNASGGVQEIKVDKGDTVRLRFTSDAALEIHIHGYDKYVDVPANGQKAVSFKADADGIYEIENHNNGSQVARLQVQP